MFALKIISHKYLTSFELQEFLDLAGKWGALKSSAIVRLIGVVLSSSVALVFEYFPLGPLDSYLHQNKNIIEEIDLVEAATYIANALWHMVINCSAIQMNGGESWKIEHCSKLNN